MKKATALNLALAGLLVLPSLVSAEIPSPNTTKDKIREEIGKERENIKERLEQRRRNARETIERRKNEFKERLEKIRDEKKKATVKRITERMDIINKNRTNAMNQFLNRLTQLLEKIQTKANAAAAAGKDMAKVEKAINDAKTSLAKALEAVNNQAAKTYTPNLGVEETLKNVVGEAMKSLEAELKATRQTIIDAKQAVANAAKELGKVRGEK